jgi:hypothetical protein
VLVGLYSVPTSIDMYMVVNQLNVTSECCAERRQAFGCPGWQLSRVCNNSSSSGWLHVLYGAGSQMVTSAGDGAEQLRVQHVQQHCWPRQQGPKSWLASTVTAAGFTIVPVCSCVAMQASMQRYTSCHSSSRMLLLVMPSAACCHAPCHLQCPQMCMQCIVTGKAATGVQQQHRGCGWGAPAAQRLQLGCNINTEAATGVQQQHRGCNWGATAAQRLQLGCSSSTEAATGVQQQHRGCNWGAAAAQLQLSGGVPACLAPHLHCTGVG